MTSYLKRANKIHFVSLDDKTYILADSGSKNKLVELNDTGSFIWDRLEKKTNLNTLVDALADYYKLESSKFKDRIKKDTRLFIKSLVRLGLVNIIKK